MKAVYIFTPYFVKCAQARARTQAQEHTENLDHWTGKMDCTYFLYQCI